jgi:glycosyltransferase involved in cell wall biosynthesis
MKVLYSCLSKSWGGMEMYTLTSVKQLLLNNIEVEILCIKGSNLDNEAKLSSIITHSISSDSYFNPTGIFRIMQILNKENFDLIHTQASRDLWLLVPALKLAGSKIPLVFTKQVGSFVVKRDLLHKIIYKRVSLAFAISEVIKKNMNDTTPLLPEKIRLLYNCIDINKFNPANARRMEIRNEFSVDKSDLLIGMMARFSPGKGHEDFLGAAKMLKDTYNNLKFMIVGKASYGEEDYEREIKDLAAKTGLTNVIFTGFRKDTSDILSAMDIFVFPSHAEAFGIALIEAMAMQLPTISANADGVLDITVDGETGYLFENKNVHDLCDKISRLIKSGGDRSKFGIAGRNRVMDKFNIEKQTAEIIKIYSSLISKEI